MERMKCCIRILLSSFLTGVGASFMIKANLGINAFDGLAANLALSTGMKIGTVSILLNLSFFLIQLVLLKGKAQAVRYLQIPLSLILGATINYITYEILESIAFPIYGIRMLVFLLGLVLCAVSCAVLLHYQIGFPLEAFCKLTAEKMQLRFSILRQIMDGSCMVLIVLLYFTQQIPINIREGTILSMMLLGPMIELFTKRFFPNTNPINI